MATVHPNRRTERAGANALRTLLEAHDHPVQEISGGTDHGEDYFVMITRAQKRTGYAFTVQVKTGKKYKRARGYAINVGSHATDWRTSKLPVIGVVYDLDEQRLFWVNLTEQLNITVAAPSWVAVPRENELCAASVEALCAHIEEFTDKGGGPGAGAAPQPASRPTRRAPVFRTPKQLWQQATGAPEAWQPQVANGWAIVRHGYRLRVLDAMSGAPKWSVATAFDRANPVGDGAVFVSAGAGRLRALALRDGHRRWERPLRVRDDLMAYSDGTLYAPTEQGGICALNSLSGDTRWTASGQAGTLTASVLVDGGRCFALRSGCSPQEDATKPAGRVVAMSTTDGTELWQYRAGAELASAWHLDGDLLYVIERPGSDSSTVVALQKRTGHPLWSTRLPEPVLSAPTVAGESLHVAGSRGGLYQISRASGTQRHIPAGTPLTASPVVAHDLVMVNQGRTLAAYATATGELYWRRRLPGLALGQPFVVGHAVYLAHRAGLASYNITASGRQLWSSEMTWDAPTQGEPVLVDDTLFLTDRRGVVRALSVS
ncbi:PQQ-binding-like beta-propeller repeat protein [Streptomyces sp. NPDC059785]|uniref:outer membrane protein assembly factor BamB family protein n=1 Tax=Streptomyces sp. NPDC059785 TaxID=3346945 RepID=UPI0036577E64